jgi:HEAT repeat protein
MTTDLQHLLDALADPLQPIQNELLEAASDLDSPRLQTFQTAWSSWDPARRIQVLEHLGQLADEDIELNFDRINRLALGDEEPRIRRQAIQNLWECEDPSLGQQLAGLVEADSSAEVRATGAAALGRFVYLGEIEEIDEELLRQVEARLLAAQRDDPEEPVRLRSLESLGYSSRPEIAPLIEAAYRSGQEARMQSALRAMARSASPAWEASILANLHHAAPGLRAEAARAAGELELSDCVDDLIELTEDAIDDVRLAAIWSLAQIGGQEASQALTRLLESAEDADEIALIEDGLDYIAFVDGTRNIPLLDLDHEDPSR